MVDHPDRIAAITRHEESVRSQIRREALVGLMNAPKLRRLVNSLEPFALRHRRKLVYEDEPEDWATWREVQSRSYIDSQNGPVRSFAIEWMEIAPNEAN